MDQAKSARIARDSKPEVKYVLTLAGDGLTSNPAAGEIVKDTDVTVTVVVPAGKQIKSFTVAGVDKKSELVEGKYTFKITADTEVKVEYEDKPSPVVEPKIELSETAVVVQKEVAIEEDANGIITGVFNKEGREPIDVTLVKGSKEYSNVRIIVEGATDGIQLLALDGAVWHNIVKTGWGDSDGFIIADATTSVYVVANKTGTYNLTIKLIDVSNENAVLESATGKITVE